MFEKYARYGLNDFVQDEAFARWVKSPDRESDLFWSEFLVAFPFRREVVDQARQVVLNLKDASRTEVREEDAMEIWQTIQSSIADRRQVVPLWKKRWMIWAAAIFMMIAGVAGWQALNRKTIEIANTTLKPMLIHLPDESQVTLQPHGRLRYKHGFRGRNREVYLVGEAFFDVTRDPQKPFIVYANDVITRVLGTSFNIKANIGGEDVTVTVKTGKVTVYTNRKNAKGKVEAHGVVLKPNQQVAYVKNMKKITKTLVAEPLPVLPSEAIQPLFVNTPVTEIFSELEKAYGVEILFDSELLAGCRLTSSFESKSLFERLDVLCEAIGATYEVVNARIVINGKKCQ